MTTSVWRIEEDLLNAPNQNTLARLMLIGITLIIASGCGSGRKTQCRELGNAANQVMGKVDAVYQSQIGGNAYDPGLERKLAEAWEAGMGLVEAVDLSDKMLESIRDDLAAAYQQAATSSQQAAELIPVNGLLSTETEQQVDALHVKSQAGIPSAMNELNLYCIGG